jgi:hypothetical protein
MSRGGVFWFALAGVLAIARWSLELAEIQYYDPESLLDYSGVILQTAAALATGIALLVLWRNPPVRRGAFLIGLGGVAAIAQGSGNLFEDAFGLEWAVWGFFVGGIGLVITLALAGILALSVSDSARWAGVFLLLGATGGMLGLGLLVMGISWLAFGFWIQRRVRVSLPTPAI